MPPVFVDVPWTDVPDPLNPPQGAIRLSAANLKLGPARAAAYAAALVTDLEGKVDGYLGYVNANRDAILAEVAARQAAVAAVASAAADDASSKASQARIQAQSAAATDATAKVAAIPAGLASANTPALRRLGNGATDALPGNTPILQPYQLDQVGGPVSKSAFDALAALAVSKADLPVGIVPASTGSPTVDAAVAQSVIDSVNAKGGGVVQFPAGSWSGNFALYPKVAVLGAGMDATTFTSPVAANFVFSYRSPISGTAGESFAPTFTGITVSARNGIDINRSGDFATVFDKQDFLFGLRLIGVRLLGTYPGQTDANRDTAVVPTQAELDGYGIGIRAAKCFNLQIDKTSIISSFGVGARLDGCDRAVMSNRFIGNARQWAALGHDTYGGEPSTPNAEHLVNRRAGAVYLSGVGSADLSRAYYECYTPAACYWITSNDTNTRITENRVTDPGGTSPIKIASFAPNVGLRVENNIYEGGSTLRGTVEMLATNYPGNGTLVKSWRGNGAMPTPNVSQMATTLVAATTLTLPDTDKDKYFVSGTTTIDNIAPSYPLREVTLASINGFTARHFAGSAGNLRTKSGADTTVPAYGNITFIFYGDVWAEKR